MRILQKELGFIPNQDVSSHFTPHYHDNLNSRNATKTSEHLLLRVFHYGYCFHHITSSDLWLRNKKSSNFKWVWRDLLQNWYGTAVRKYKFQTQETNSAHRNRRFILKPAQDYCQHIDFLLVIHTEHNDLQMRDFFRATYGVSNLIKSVSFMDN